MDTIRQSDAVLYVDLECQGCGRRVAIPNTIVHDGKHYHKNCLPVKNKKAPEVEAFLERFVKEAFGRTRQDGSCATCDDPKILENSDFRDELSWHEFKISCMCQSCQDSVFSNKGDE
jgi:hypothetical protein